MPTHHLKSKIWYFVFTNDQGDLPWYQRLIAKSQPNGFKHVTLFCNIGPRILRIDPTRGCIEFSEEFIEKDHSAFIAGDMYAQVWSEKPNVTVVKHEYIPNIGNWKFITSIIPSCVSAVRLASGYPTLSVTPLQLYNSLIKSGGKQIGKES